MSNFNSKFLSLVAKYNSILICLVELNNIWIVPYYKNLV